MPIRMSGSKVCIVLFLVVTAIVAEQTPEPSEIICKESTTYDGLQFSKNEITFWPRIYSNITHEINGSGYQESGIFCNFEVENVLLYQILSKKDEIICKCTTKYCNPNNWAIEQRLNETRWQRISSVSKIDGDYITVTASRTQFNSSTYRCIIWIDRWFNGNSTSAISLDHIIFDAVGHVIVYVPLLGTIVILSVLMLLWKTRVAVAVVVA